MSLEIQALTILHMMAAGIFLGAALDSYLRLFWKKRRFWLTSLMDLLFWILCGVFVFMWLRLVNQGQMRLVIFLALFCGYAAYQALFQRLYTRLLERLIQLVKILYRLTKRLLYLFVYKPLSWIISLVTALCIFHFKLALRLVRLLIYPLLQVKKGFLLLLAKWSKKKDE